LAGIQRLRNRGNGSTVGAEAARDHTATSGSVFSSQSSMGMDTNVGPQGGCVAR
jgi:hypothetical protein